MSSVDPAPSLKAAGIGSSSQIQPLFGFARRSFGVYIITWTFFQARFCTLPDRKGLPYRRWDPRLTVLFTCRIENLD